MPDGSHSLFALGQRGVNNTVSPVHLSESELVSAQNAEAVVIDGVGALDQRAGMSLMTPTPLGAAIVTVHDVPAPLRLDVSPNLFTTAYIGNFTFRTSKDGATWANVPPSAIPVYAMNNFLDFGYFKSWPKVVTVGNKIYFIAQPTTSGTDPLQLWSYDGSVANHVADVPPGVVGGPLATPNAPTVATNGTTGATTYSYVWVAKNGSTHGKASTAGTITIGNASLNFGAGNYNTLQTVSAPIVGATSYDVYRTVGGATQGKIGSIPIVGGQFTTGNGSGVGPLGVIFTDGGLTGDGTSPPNTTGGTLPTQPVGYTDLITDGTLIYISPIDSVSAGNGRILQFDPTPAQWSQIGTAFPLTSNVNGVAVTPGVGGPGALVLHDGALSFTTFLGTPSGNQMYATTTGSPYPVGGIPEVQVFAASILPVSMAVFQGQLYVGMAWLGAPGTAATIQQRTALATWTTVQTGPGTGTLNAYTSLGVYNGRLYAGWASGDGSQAGVIQSSPDGVNWTTEYTGDAASVPCQMVVFNNELYVVFGQTPMSGNNTSKVVKRTIGGTWTTQDTGSGFKLTGGIGIAWF